jgi:molybdenum cofactor cytidylyltransferase
MTSGHNGLLKIAGLMLAAGQSKRFNGIKQLADLDGQPMLRHTLNNVTLNGRLLKKLTEFSVILGANAESISPIVPGYVTTHVFEGWSKGMGATLAFGVQKVNSESSHILVTLADQVALTGEQIETMLHHCSIAPDKIIAASYEDVLGAPVIFPRRYFRPLMSLQGDIGARKILKHHEKDVLAVSLANAQYDIDTQCDFIHWQRFIC